MLAHQLNAMTLDGQPLAFPREVVYPHEGHWRGVAAGDAGRARLPHVGMGGGWSWFFGWRTEGKMEALGSAFVGGVTAAVSALMATLFGLMALATDHNDTWWNAVVGRWEVGV